MIPLFKKNDINLFKKYINQSKIYFEYGCGGSTYLASLCNNIEKIYTVESDIEWLNKVQLHINKKKDITYISYLAETYWIANETFHHNTIHKDNGVFVIVLCLLCAYVSSP